MMRLSGIGAVLVGIGVALACDNDSSRAVTVRTGGGDPDAASVSGASHGRSVDAALDASARNDAALVNDAGGLSDAALPFDGPLLFDGALPFEVSEGVLAIRIRNLTAHTQYVDTGHWVFSASDAVQDFDNGMSDAPLGQLSMRTNLPVCDDALETYGPNFGCSSSGDTDATTVQIAPGGEYVLRWYPWVWKRAEQADSGCTMCARPVQAPAGPYLIRVNASFACEGSGCGCEVDQHGSCIAGGSRTEDPTIAEQPFDWPAQQVIVELH